MQTVGRFFASLFFQSLVAFMLTLITAAVFVILILYAIFGDKVSTDYSNISLENCEVVSIINKDSELYKVSCKQ